MIDPASTVAPPADPAVARGVLREVRDGAIVLAILGTEYRLLLSVETPLTARVGDTVEGRINAQARRMDIIQAGGRYVEPIEGHPRRVQGRVIGHDEASRAVVVRAGVPIACRTNDMQKPADFPLDAMVSMDVLPGATFTPKR